MKNGVLKTPFFYFDKKYYFCLKLKYTNMLQKYDLKVFGLVYENYYLIENINQYKEYMDIMNNKFDVSESEIKNLKTFIGHGYSYLTGLSTMFCGTIEDKEEREPMLAHLKYLHGKTLVGQLEYILKGYKLAINDNGGYFPIKPDEKFEILKTYSNKYTKDEV